MSQEKQKATFSFSFCQFTGASRVAISLHYSREDETQANVYAKAPPQRCNGITFGLSGFVISKMEMISPHVLLLYRVHYIKKKGYAVLSTCHWLNEYHLGHTVGGHIRCSRIFYSLIQHAVRLSLSLCPFFSCSIYQSYFGVLTNQNQVFDSDLMVLCARNMCPKQSQIQSGFPVMFSCLFIYLVNKDGNIEFFDQNQSQYQWLQCHYFGQGT